MEAALDGQHTGTPGGGAADLDRRLDGLRAGAREERSPQQLGRPREQRLGEQSGERTDAERELARRVELERLDESGTYARIVAADVVHPEAAQPIEVAGSLGVVQMRALRTSPCPVVADRPQHPHVLRVDRAGVELERVICMRRQQLPQVELGHARERSAHASCGGSQ